MSIEIGKRYVWRNGYDTTWEGKEPDPGRTVTVVRLDKDAKYGPGGEPWYIVRTDRGSELQAAESELTEVES